MAKNATRLMAITDGGLQVHIVALADIQADEISVLTLCGLHVAPRLLVDLETPNCTCKRCHASLKTYGNRIGFTDAQR